MENTELTALVSEMRAEFQIPPYYEVESGHFPHLRYLKFL